MAIPRKHYIIGSTVAVTGAATFLFFSKMWPAELPWQYKRPVKTNKKSASWFELKAPESVQTVTETIPTFLNQEQFTRCRIRHTEYETPDTKRVSIECPIDERFCAEGEERKPGDLISTKFIVREPEGSEKNYFPIFENSVELSDGNADDHTGKTAVNFDILVKREKMCRNSMFLHAVYPDEYVEVKGPYKSRIEDFSVNDSSAAKKSIWQTLYHKLKRNYTIFDEPARRYFIASGADGVSQVYSAIDQLKNDDLSQNRRVENFLLLSADSATDIPLINELAANLRKHINPSKPNGESFYQYITLDQPRWGWQGGYGKIDRQLLKGVIGTRKSNQLANRDVLMIVAGDADFKNGIQKELTEGLMYSASDVQCLE
ncbi:NADH-cytochrome b5 reductase [Perkinsela sp. CCAP 1560/4]|nr:NADH-cytochrome b5 reductase [Perkinsela sp. CCAP 1560/4]|eukprot:KNH06979.1 NADH-cytochrome b5 reductase [Perkinsela sp. CCAP 1560/4]